MGVTYALLGIGQTPLTMSISGGATSDEDRSSRCALAKMLLDAGASVEPAKNMAPGPLHRAAAEGKPCSVNAEAN